MKKRTDLLRTRTRFLLAAMVLVFTLLSGCNERDPLLGVWQEPSSGVILELKDGGELVISLGNSSFRMMYERKDPDILILTAYTEGSLPDQEMKFRLDEDRLVITADGVDTVFTRVKK